MTDWVDEIPTSSGKNTRLLRMTDWVDEIPTSQNRLFRKTEWVDVIPTLSKHKKVVLLALTVLDGYFFHLVLSSSLDVKPIKQEQITHQE
jgi:hypothetical protein